MMSATQQSMNSPLQHDYITSKHYKNGQIAQICYWTYDGDNTYRNKIEKFNKLFLDTVGSKIGGDLKNYQGDVASIPIASHVALASKGYLSEDAFITAIQTEEGGSYENLNENETAMGVGTDVIIPELYKKISKKVRASIKNDAMHQWSVLVIYSEEDGRQKFILEAMVDKDGSPIVLNSIEEVQNYTSDRIGTTISVVYSNTYGGKANTAEEDEASRDRRLEREAEMDWDDDSDITE